MFIFIGLHANADFVAPLPTASTRTARGWRCSMRSIRERDLVAMRESLLRANGFEGLEPKPWRGNVIFISCAFGS